MLPHEDVEWVSEALRHQWSATEQGWQDAEAVAGQFGFAAGRPVRFFVGGVGSNRSLEMRPMPVSGGLWNALHTPMVNAEGVPMDLADVCRTAPKNISD